MHLSHLQSLLLCALLISIVFACVFEDTAKERFLSAIRYFVLLVVVSILAAWLMYLFSH
ncbi:MAG: hypothetical protein WBD87_16150 [Candidatus Acidiferrales bacterium]